MELPINESDLSAIGKSSTRCSNKNTPQPTGTRATSNNYAIGTT
jgi:hypothetical protein